MYISVFSGDPLEFTFFIRAFEHGVENENKTTNNKDRLYFLEQFTTGQPKVLVCSCQHIPSERGYREAKILLYQHFQIKSLLLSHHHSTCALVSEILESVLQTV